MIQWIKRLFSTDQYNQASIRMMENYGRAGSHVQPFNYRHAVRLYRSWVYAAAHINATAVAASPLRLYIRSKSRTKSMWQTRPVSKGRRAYMYGDMGGDVAPSRGVMTKIMDLGDDYEEVTEMHPVIELLQKANHSYNGFDLTVLRTLYQELTGNAYLHPVFDEQLGVPTELWPMPPQWVEIIPDTENFIKGYLYGQTGVEQLVFERDEVIHFKRPNPDNLFYGLGKVEAAYGTIQANEAMHDMDLATFHNHARPDYAVVVKGPVRRDDLDQFEQHVGERLRGTRKAGQFLTVSGDVSFQPLNFPPKDVGGREEIVEEIAAVFGVPVSMLKANDPNLASAKAGFGQWRESTILPMLRMDEDVLNQVLLPLFGIEEDAVLCYDNPVPADKEYELRQRQTAVAGGWQTLNEARLEQGMEQSDDPLADELLLNGMPLGQQPSPFGGLPFGPAMPALEQEQPLPQPEPEPAQPQEQVSEIDEKLALNGAQIASLVEVLQNISTGVIAREAGIEVIVATGIGREQAQQMVDSQKVSGEVPEELTEEAPPATESKSLPKPEDIAGELYNTPEEAAVRAEELGGEGYHAHETTEGVFYMPFFNMDDYTEVTGIDHKKSYGMEEDFLLGNDLAVVSYLDAAATKNCGTGAGGFQPGNDCAAGDGSGSQDDGSGDGKKEKPVEITKEQRQKLDAAAKDAWTLLPSGEREAATDVLAELPPEQRAEEMAKIFGTQAESGEPFGLPDSEDQLSAEMQESGVYRKSNAYDDYLAGEGRTSDHSRYNALSSDYKNAVKAIAVKRAGALSADGQPMAGASSAEKNAFIEAETHRMLTVALGADRKAAVESMTKLIQDGSKPFEDNDAFNRRPDILEIMGATDAVDANADPKLAQLEYSVMDDKRRGAITAAYDIAKSEYEELKDMGAAEVYRYGERRSQDVEHYFAKKGVAVKVDPVALIPRDLNAPEDEFPEERVIEQTNNISAGYREIIELDQAIEDMRESGYDLSSVNYTIRNRNKHHSGTNPFTRANNVAPRAQAYYNQVDQVVTLPADTGPVKGSTGYSIGGGSNYNNAIHETMHALHANNMSKQNDVFDLDESANERLGSRIAKKMGIPDDLTGTRGERRAIGYEVFSTASYNRMIERATSAYGNTSACEFVAEAGTMKIIDPKGWKEVQNRKLDIAGETKESLLNLVNRNRLYGEELKLEDLKDVSVSIADLYEMLGGV